MKKFIRYTAVLGAVLTVLGFGTASAAHIQGGRWTKMHIWESAIHHPRRNYSYSVPVGADRGTQLDESSKSFPCLPEFSLEVDFGDVTVSRTDTDRIVISCGSSSDFNQVVWAYAYDSEVKLVVYGKRSEGRKPNVIVMVPQNYHIQEMDIELAEGSCVLEEIEVGELSGETAGGTLLVEEGRASEASFSCAAGEISYYGQVVGDVDIDCAAGNIIYSGEILGSVDADCAAGNIYLELPGQQETDFNLEVEGTGGSIQVGEQSYAGMLFEKEINHGASRTMELQSAAGNIQVEFESRETSMEEAERCPAAEVQAGDAEVLQEYSAEEAIVEEGEEKTKRRKR